MSRTVSEICVELAITIEQLAERSGLERGRIEAIILRRWTPSPEDRRRIAAVLGVAVDDIAWGHATPIQHLYGHGPT
jgi:transcriptional regulator with XRE-family HTH domain